ncbi:glycosyltransferase family 2 protein [Metabacillus fastidiosus]|uniref:glycosyltransferase family 2 protein n=1 Tax=Metabacillus fastidiosus TaxID=1458 RepID=UPI002DB80071|nr:glycosyltransferase family 2 protein [Metabacillus fastidiosus]MEC2077081.1 glycosyltransferase family 2 protein [Metabacillus fastidiosus]
MINYDSPTILKKAVLSLHLLDPLIKKITIFKNKNVSFSLKDLPNELNTEIINIKNEDVGDSLNNYIPKIKSPFVLFLNNHQFLIPSIKNFCINDRYSIITAPQHFKNIKIECPFIVRTSFLKQTRFFLKHQIPFKEAILYAWLKENCDFKMISLDREVTRQQYTKNLIKKMEFINKYHFKKKSNETRKPTLSVIIANYNMENYIETAVSSYLLQNESADQLVVVDDGSTDNSIKCLESWKQTLNFKLLSINKNIGKARALNYALPYVNSDYILELDADDWLDPDAVFTIKNYLKTISEDVSVLYGNLRNWKQIEEYGVKFMHIKKGKQVTNEDELLSYSFPLGPRIYNKSALNTIGGFPIIRFEDGRLYEDVSVLRELINFGRLLYCDFTVYNTRQHQASITKRHYSKWNDYLKYI